jgi:DNA-binding HxlR family transcriptional regulator
MKGYGQYCPLAKGAEIVAERWTPLILRELLFGEHTFNDIQRGVPLMSRSLLVKRLRELEKAGVIERKAGKRGSEYHLTHAGKELEATILAIATWGYRWTQSNLTTNELDPRPLMWDMRRNMIPENVPIERTVVQFSFPDVPKPALKRTWMVIEEGQIADVCYKDPGFEVDLIVTGPLQNLVDIWLGDTTFRQALASESIQIDGPRRLVSSFVKWWGLSVMQSVKRPAGNKHHAHAG